MSLFPLNYDVFWLDRVFSSSCHYMSFSIDKCLRSPWILMASYLKPGVSMFGFLEEKKSHQTTTRNNCRSGKKHISTCLLDTSRCSKLNEQCYYFFLSKHWIPRAKSDFWISSNRQYKPEYRVVYIHSFRANIGYYTKVLIVFVHNFKRSSYRAHSTSLIIRHIFTINAKT